jgi:heme/copper-type cytochrome/quinol oxidase subunit 2
MAVLAMVGWLAIYGAALAQMPGKPKAAPAQNINSMTYVMAYFLVIFGVALGMLFVCRSSNRRERARPEQFEAKTAKGEEEE